VRQTPESYEDLCNQCAAILVTVSPTVQPPLYDLQAAVTWWIDGILAEEVCQWEEEDHLTCKEQEHRKMGQHWVDLDGNQLMDVEDEATDTLLRSGIENDKDDTGEIKVLKVCSL